MNRWSVFSHLVTLLAMAADAPVMPPAAATPTPTAVRASEAPSVSGDRITPAAAATPPATVVAPPVMPAIFVPFETFKRECIWYSFQKRQKYWDRLVMLSDTWLIWMKLWLTAIIHYSQKWLTFWLYLDWLDLMPFYLTWSRYLVQVVSNAEHLSSLFLQVAATCRQQEVVNLDAHVKVFSFNTDDPAMCCENILSQQHHPARLLKGLSCTCRPTARKKMLPSASYTLDF